MAQERTILFPTTYATAGAVGFADANGNFVLVDENNPLPVLQASAQPGGEPQPAIPLAGTAAADMVAGPFTPVAGTPVVLTLSGSWQGSVQIERSSDGGVTRHPVTAAGGEWGRYTANACEPAWEENEEGAALYLAITVESGAVDYRVAQ